MAVVVRGGVAEHARRVGDALAEVARVEEGHGVARGAHAGRHLALEVGKRVLVLAHGRGRGFAGRPVGGGDGDVGLDEGRAEGALVEEVGVFGLVSGVELGEEEALVFREDARRGRELLAGDARDQEALAREVLAGGKRLVDTLGCDLEGVATSLQLGTDALLGLLARTLLLGGHGGRVLCLRRSVCRRCDRILRRGWSGFLGGLRLRRRLALHGLGGRSGLLTSDLGGRGSRIAGWLGLSGGLCRGLLPRLFLRLGRGRRLEVERAGNLARVQHRADHGNRKHPAQARASTRGEATRGAGDKARGANARVMRKQSQATGHLRPQRKEGLKSGTKKPHGPRDDHGNKFQDICERPANHRTPPT